MNPILGPEREIEVLLQQLGTVTGVVGLLAFLILFCLTPAAPKLRWIVLALALWTVSLSYFATEGFDQPLIFPLQQIRTEGRPLTTALLGSLIIPSILSDRGWRFRLISGGTIGFFVFEMLFCFRDALVGDFDRGVLGAFSFVILFIVMGYGLPKWIQSLDQFHTALKSIALMAAIFCVTNFCQTIINPAGAIWVGRFFGTTGNPQHAAILLALCFIPVCYLTARKHESGPWRLAYGVLAGAIVTLLLWTGSRTGLLMATLGLVLTFRHRLGRFVLGMGIVGVVALLMLNFYRTDATISAHILSMEDTRTMAWYAQLAEFRQHPWLGDLSHQEFVSRENSYLGTAARYGLFGLIPLLIAVACAAVVMVRASRVKRYLGDYAMAIDMVNGSLAALAVGAWFEAYLLGTYFFAVYFAYFCFAVLNALRDIATWEKLERSQPALGAVQWQDVESLATVN